jgi:hypothetical protein
MESMPVPSVCPSFVLEPEELGDSPPECDHAFAALDFAKGWLSALLLLFPKMVTKDGKELWKVSEEVDSLYGTLSEAIFGEWSDAASDAVKSMRKRYEAHRDGSQSDHPGDDVDASFCEKIVKEFLEQLR